MVKALHMIRAGIVAGCLALAAPASADTIVRVIDGDTLVARIDGVEERVRLSMIDTPERGHRAKCAREAQLADAATLAVINLISISDHVTVVPMMRGDVYARDRWGRVLGDVWLDGVRLSYWLLQAGFARVWPDGEKWWCK